MTKCGIVVPTLGNRPALLNECLQSIQEAGYDTICIVSPTKPSVPIISGANIIHLQDPGLGAAAAINIGLIALIEAEGCHIVAWLGDDDTISPDQLTESMETMKTSGAVAVVGTCIYVDEFDRVIFTSRPRRKDVWLLEYWANRLPQPGSIFLSRAVIEAGLLDENLKYAFDQDLFHKLKQIGRISISKSVLSRYRWHPGSLSSTGRVVSAQESQDLRLKYGQRILKPFTRSWFALYRALSRFMPSKLP